MWDGCSVSNQTNQEIPEGRRILPDEPLAFDLACRRAEARVLTPWDADARYRWFADCGRVLAQVPDLTQRLCWAGLLAEDFSMIGTPTRFVVGLLLNYAEHAARVRR